MKIKELNLKHFGKFSEKQISFSEGINLIYGENEAGKSTIYAGIKAILFGMVRGRGRAAAKDAFQQYEPWEQSNYYAGHMVFESGDKNFSLERNFDKYGKGAKLFCLEDGEQLSVKDGDLQEILDGMTEAEFENTVAVGQLRVVTNGMLASELKNYAANYYSTGDNDLELDSALNVLKERKKAVDREMKAHSLKKLEKRELKESEASYVWRDLRRMEKEYTKMKSSWAKNNETLKKKEESAEEGKSKRSWNVHPAWIVAMILLLIAVIVLLDKPWDLIVATVIALAEGTFVWNRMKYGKDKQDMEAAENERLKELRATVEKQEWQLERMREEYMEKRTLYENLKEQVGEFDEVDEETKELEKKRRVLEMAEEILIKTAKEMHNQLSTVLDRRVSEIVREITNGKYEKVWIGEEYQIHLLSAGKKISVDQVSRGTLEQIYFALRMASVELLHAEEYPVLLDDTFAYYDDVRLEATLKWLVKNRKQILLLTCQKREEELLRKNGIVYNKITI